MPASAGIFIWLVLPGKDLVRVRQNAPAFWTPKAGRRPENRLGAIRVNPVMSVVLFAGPRFIIGIRQIFNPINVQSLIKSLAKVGCHEALIRNPQLASGLNIHVGRVIYEAVATIDLGPEHRSAADKTRRSARRYSTEYVVFSHKVVIKGREHMHAREDRDNYPARFVQFFEELMRFFVFGK